MLNRSHVATIWNFDPNYSLPNVAQVSLPKKFQIVAMWLQFSTKEYSYVGFVRQIWVVREKPVILLQAGKSSDELSCPGFASADVRGAVSLGRSERC